MKFILLWPQESSTENTEEIVKMSNELKEDKKRMALKFKLIIREKEQDTLFNLLKIPVHELHLKLTCYCNLYEEHLFPLNKIYSLKLGFIKNRNEILKHLTFKRLLPH